MLAEQLFPAAKGARFQLHTADPILTRLLEVLLLEWGYERVAAGATAEMHIVQEDYRRKDSIWLSSAPNQEPCRVALPLIMEVLWGVMEACLHAQPRRHLRLATRLPALLQVVSKRIAVMVGSLSDHGVRFRARRELARDEEVLLHIDCNAQMLSLPGRVIYCMPKGDLDGVGGYETGLVFVAPDADLRQKLREMISASYVQRVRTALSPAEFAAALPLLHLSAAVLAHFESPGRPPYFLS